MNALDSLLTHREREVLSLMALGHTDCKIAEQLIISKCIVKRHLCNIFLKFAVSGRVDTIKHAMRPGVRNGCKAGRNILHGDLQ